MTIYYISPTGSNSNNGLTSGTPWKTFAFAIPLLGSGDTLTLLNGTYTQSDSGMILINNKNGSVSQPITLKADNERQAFISSDGTASPLDISGSSYLNIEGLMSQLFGLKIVVQQVFQLFGKHSGLYG